MKEHAIHIQKTAFYSLSGTTDTPSDVWFVLHGYGQLSRYFIKHFDVVLDEHTLVIAPEAPSRFYLSNDYGRVGASWMTKHERESDILDINAYLNQLFDTLSERYSFSAETRFHFLGFSQGVPVLCRWLAQRNENVEQLILWAGAVPHDMPLDQLKQLLLRGRSCIVYGTEDPYLKQPEVPILKTALNQQQLPVDIYTFPGEHTLDADTLRMLKDKK